MQVLHAVHALGCRPLGATGWQCAGRRVQGAGWLGRHTALGDCASVPWRRASGARRRVTVRRVPIAGCRVPGDGRRVPIAGWRVTVRWLTGRAPGGLHVREPSAGVRVQCAGWLARASSVLGACARAPCAGWRVTGDLLARRAPGVGWLACARSRATGARWLACADRAMHRVTCVCRACPAPGDGWLACTPGAGCPAGAGCRVTCLCTVVGDGCPVTCMCGPRHAPGDLSVQSVPGAGWPGCAEHGCRRATGVLCAPDGRRVCCARPTGDGCRCPMSGDSRNVYNLSAFSRLGGNNFMSWHNLFDTKALAHLYRGANPFFLWIRTNEPHI